MNHHTQIDKLKIIEKHRENKDCLKVLGYDDPKINILTLYIEGDTFYALKPYKNHIKNEDITPMLCFTDLNELTGYVYTMIRRGFDCISDIDENRLNFDINIMEPNIGHTENGNLEIELNGMKYIYGQLSDKEWLELSDLLTDEHKIKKTKCRFKREECKC